MSHLIFGVVVVKGVAAATWALTAASSEMSLALSQGITASEMLALSLMEVALCWF